MKEWRSAAAILAVPGWILSGLASISTGDTPTLGVRNGHALAYDAETGHILLFGGADERKVRGDLWVWDGRRWQILEAEGPAPRTFPSLAYDRARRRLVLFGGNRVLFGSGEEHDTLLADMWEWYQGSWHQSNVHTPPARAEACMAYDADRQRLVLFGGYSGSGPGRRRFGDTWEFDGSNWEKMKTPTAPSARNGAAMVYDSKRRRVVLFGGSGGPSAETWEWDGSAWAQVPAATPGRYNTAMAYDASLGEVVRFGGWDGEGRTADTWRYDGRRWEQLWGTGPEARNHSSMAYDERRGSLVLFGGHDGERVFGDTWERRAGAWSRVSAQEPRDRIDNGH